MRVVTTFPRDVNPKPPFQLIQDDSWQQFVIQVKSKHVEASFVGLFQPYFVWHDHKRTRVAEHAESKHQNKYDARLVLLSVSDVVGKPRFRM